MQKDIEKSNKLAKQFRILGAILTAIGLIMIIVAFSNFSGSMDNMSNPSTSQFGDNSDNTNSSFVSFIVGGIFLMIGTTLLGFGYKKKVARFESAQLAPVAKDVTNYMLDETKDSLTDVMAEGIKKSRDTYTDNSERKDKSYCTSCGHEVEKDDSFCPNCGNKLD